MPKENKIKYLMGELYISFLSIIILSTTVMSQNQDKTDADNLVSISSEKIIYSLNEPIVLNLTVINPYETSCSLDLGYDGVGAISVRVFADSGAFKKYEVGLKNGVSRTGIIKIMPSQNLTRRLFLNRWVGNLAKGRYTIEIDLTRVTYKKNYLFHFYSNSTSYNILSQNKLSIDIEVKEKDVKELDRLCKTLSQRIINPQSVELMEQDAEELSFVSDDIAVPYLKNIMSLNGGLYRFVVKGLARINSDSAIQSLIGFSLLTKEEVRSCVLETLFEIQSSTNSLKRKQIIHQVLQNSQIRTK
jgi:hypothetical protein